MRAIVGEDAGSELIGLADSDALGKVLGESAETVKDAISYGAIRGVNAINLATEKLQGQ